MSEGIGRVLRFGANGPDVIERLRWIETVLAPTLKAAVQRAAGIDLKAIQAQALLMGDEVHSRNAAATLQFLSAIALPLADADVDRAAVRRIARICRGQFAVLPQPLDGGLEGHDGRRPRHRRVQCRHRDLAQRRDDGDPRQRIGGRMVRGASDLPAGLYFPGFVAEDANADLGDSAICETAGFGGFALAASPALVQLVGGTVRQAIAYSREMQHVALARNPSLSLPNLDFAGTPCGIDIRKVVDNGIRPVLTTGIAHREAGVGQIGAGIVRTPMACYASAVLALALRLGIDPAC